MAELKNRQDFLRRGKFAAGILIGPSLLAACAPAAAPAPTAAPAASPTAARAAAKPTTAPAAAPTTAPALAPTAAPVARPTAAANAVTFGSNDSNAVPKKVTQDVLDAFGEQREPFLIR